MFKMIVARCSLTILYEFKWANPLWVIFPRGLFAESAKTKTEQSKRKKNIQQKQRE